MKFTHVAFTSFLRMSTLLVLLLTTITIAADSDSHSCISSDGSDSPIGCMQISPEMSHPSLLPPEYREENATPDGDRSWWSGTTNLTLDVIYDVLHSSAFIPVSFVSSSYIKQLSALFWPTVYGSSMVLFSWLLVYYDSKVPGVYPPTPVSPKKYRMKSGHTFHLGYTIGLLNGIIVFVLSLWQAVNSHPSP